MQYLVLALCVCAASAASYGGYTPYQGQQFGKASAQAQAVFTPSVAVEEPPVAPVVKASPVPVAAYNAGAKAASTVSEGAAAIVRYDNEVSADGYSNYFETENGISVQSSGSLKKVNNDDVLVMQGAIQYQAPDGTPVVLTYVADENGYQPKSDLLPVAPPIPEAILRSLEYIRTHAPKQDEYNY